VGTHYATLDMEMRNKKSYGEEEVIHQFFLERERDSTKDFIRNVSESGPQVKESI